LCHHAARFHAKNDPVRHIHLPPAQAAARKPGIVVMIFVPFAGDEAVKKLVHRLAVFFGADQRAVAAIIKIADDESEQKVCRNPRPNSPPPGDDPGEASPKKVRENSVREIVPDRFDRTRELILPVGIGDQADVFQTLDQPVIFAGGQFTVGLLLGFGCQITSQPTEMRAVRVARFVGFGMVNPVRNHIAFFAETDWICPQKYPGEPDAPEFEGLMRAIPMIPNRVINRADETCEENHGQNCHDGKMRCEKPDEHTKRGAMIPGIRRRDQPRAIFPETDGIKPFDQNFNRGRSFGCRTGISIGWFIQD